MEGEGQELKILFDKMIIFASAALVRQRCGAWHGGAPARV